MFSIKAYQYELQINIEIYHLYLDWLSRYIKLYEYYFLSKYSIKLSNRTISNWFSHNNNYKSIFASKNYIFNKAKYSDQNTMYYSNCK